MEHQPPVPEPHDDELTAAEEDWVLSTEFEWHGHHHRAHIYALGRGVYMIQVEDLDEYELVVATSPKFRMPIPMLQSVEVHPSGVLVATIVNQKPDRLIAKELVVLRRNEFPTAPFEEAPLLSD